MRIRNIILSSMGSMTLGFGTENPDIRGVVNQQVDEILSLAKNLEAGSSQSSQTTSIQDSAAREDFMSDMHYKFMKSQAALAETKVALANSEREKAEQARELNALKERFLRLETLVPEGGKRPTDIEERVSILAAKNRMLELRVNALKSQLECHFGPNHSANFRQRSERNSDF